MKITVQTDIPAQFIADQFVTAFEGGSSYWLRAASLLRSDVEPNPEHGPWYADPSIYDGKFCIRMTYDDPDLPEAESYAKANKRIGRVSVLRGLQRMADKAPQHFANLMSEDGDAETADVMMQYIVLGDIIFG